MSNGAMRAACEPVEQRLMLCMLHLEPGSPDLVREDPAIRLAQFDKLARRSSGGLNSSAGGAQILWSNRGNANDRFSMFGANAAAARSVVDAALLSWQNVINSFNYASGTAFVVNISMASTGAALGGAAQVDLLDSDGRPKLGTITLGRGDDTTGDGLGDGGRWFIDPTPTDHSEFGNTASPFAATAIGGPAAGMFDLYAVVVTELTHCLGLINNSSALFQSGGLNTNTGVTDNAEGGGVGVFHRFNGTIVNHLMTSNNGGPNGQDFGMPVHTAGPGANVTNGGTNYRGADDVGNAVLEFSTRYLVGDAMALIFSAAYGYSITLPSTLETFYANPDPANNRLIISGGVGTSNDVISVSTSGTTLTVSVNIGSDVPAVGAFPGVANLGAFVRTFNTSQFTSIVINSGGGDDQIAIGPTSGINISIDAGPDNDLITIGSGGNAGLVNGTVSINGSTGSDTAVYSDTAVATAQTYTMQTGSLARSGLPSHQLLSMEGVTVNAGSGNDTFTLNSSLASFVATFNGGAGTNTYTLASLNAILGPVTISSGAIGTDNVTLNDAFNFNNATYNVTTTQLTRNGFGGLTYSSVENMTINGGGGINSYTLSGPGGAPTNFTINAGDLADTVNVHIATPLALDGKGGADTLNITDPRTSANFINYDVTSTNIREALGTGTTYANMEGIVLNGGDAPNLFRVYSSAANAPITLRGNGGDDNFAIGDSVQAQVGANFASNLAIDGGLGSDDVLVFDNNGTGSTYTLGAGSFDKTNFSLLTYTASETMQVTANVSANTFNIDAQASGVPYHIQGNDGSDTFNLGLATDNLSGLLSTVTILGGNGTDQILLFDGANTSNATYTITNTQVSRGGFAGLTYNSGNESLFLSAGIGNDTINIDSLPAGVPCTVGGGNGNDNFAVGGNNFAANILSNVNIIGGSNTATGDTALFADVVNTGADTYTITSSTVGKSATAITMTYSQFERLNVSTNNGNNTVNVNSTPAGTPVHILPNQGNDTINVNETNATGPVQVNAGVGTLTVNVNTDNTGAAVTQFAATPVMRLATLNIGNGGTTNVLSGGDQVLYITSSLSINATGGRLDLFDNDLIVDYATASPMATLQTWIRNARATNTWLGPGITSTSAKNVNPKNTTLGIMEAAQFRSIYGAAANFDGQVHDSTAVLVKYTYYGDADFNGVVNFDDYSRADAGFNFGRSGWINGDFDGNGVSNFDDYSLIDLAFNTQSATL